MHARGETAMEETIFCKVVSVKYENPENGFKILRCEIKNGDGVAQNGYYFVKGVMPFGKKGQEFKATGRWVNDPRYGMQFDAFICEEQMPTGKTEVLKFLSNRNIKGIGPATARDIVDVFGGDALNVVLHEPDRLLEVNGIGPGKLEKIKESVKSREAINRTAVLLQGLGISPAYANRIYAAYKEDSVEKVKENPYQLAIDVDGIGFLLADKIADGLGFEKDCELRIQGGLLYTLDAMQNEGHTFAYVGELAKKCSGLLDIPQDKVIDAIKAIRPGDGTMLVVEDGAVYSAYALNAEKRAAWNMVRIARESFMEGKGFKKLAKMNGKDVERMGERCGVEYAPEQADAILEACRSKAMVLTGGPGTGKTTTVNGIIKAMEECGLTVRLAAPTGKAAKRMSEATGRRATTVHVLLEAGRNGFARNATNPLDGDVLIVDESSMLDIFLTNALFKAIPDKMHLILVGDIDQLPSVGCGNVLNDIIESGICPVVRLTKIFRQAAESDIIMSAHRINRGEMPITTNAKGSDLFFINTSKMEPELIRDNIVKYATENLPNFYHVGQDDIQILAPMKNGKTGVNELNLRMQEKLNPLKPGDAVFKTFDAELRVGDKVMQTKNNYDKNVFNGEVGHVTYIGPTEDSANGIRVEFEGREIEFDENDGQRLALAYAMTVHKSQGSEYPIVVMPVNMSSFILLQRNLIYTGVTRAKQMLLIFGDKRAMHYAVNHVVAPNRNTKLKGRILDYQSGKGWNPYE